MKVVANEVMQTPPDRFTCRQPCAGFAGSPGGLQIVMVGTPKAAPYAAAVDAFFKRYDVDSSGTDCDDSQLNIDSVYAHADKAGITPAMALGATNDIKQRRSLGKMMARFRDKNHERGFDGALAYYVQDDKILLYGISAMPSIRSAGPRS